MKSFSQHEHFTQPHLEHKRHLPALEKQQRQIDEILHSVSLDDNGEFVFATKICCYTVASIISDLNRGILQCLKIESYSGAETLSRTSLENSINLIIFSKNKTSAKPKSIIVHYLKTSKIRAQKWLRYARENNDTESIKRSSEFSQWLDSLRGLFGDLETKEVKGWPDAYSRFKEAGYEHFYHILFAPASDSTHGFSNDIFNRFFGELLPVNETERQQLFDGQLAEKISFAYYLATFSILFYCAAASHIAERAENEEASKKIDTIAKCLQAMITEHETLTKACLEKRRALETPDK